MAFQQFVRSGRSQKPTAAIRKNGQIGLNSACLRKFDLSGVEHASMFFDSDSRRVGIKPSTERTDNTLPLRHRGGSATISAKGFCDFFEIDCSGSAQRFDVSWDAESEMLIFDLDRSR